MKVFKHSTENNTACSEQCLSLSGLLQGCDVTTIKPPPSDTLPHLKLNISNTNELVADYYCMSISV